MIHNDQQVSHLISQSQIYPRHLFSTLTVNPDFCGSFCGKQLKFKQNMQNWEKPLNYICLQHSQQITSSALVPVQLLWIGQFYFALCQHLIWILTFSHLYWGLQKYQLHYLAFDLGLLTELCSNDHIWKKKIKLNWILYTRAFSKSDLELNICPS